MSTKGLTGRAIHMSNSGGGSSGTVYTGSLRLPQACVLKGVNIQVLALNASNDGGQSLAYSWLSTTQASGQLLFSGDNGGQTTLAFVAGQLDFAGKANMIWIPSFQPMRIPLPANTVLCLCTVYGGNLGSGTGYTEAIIYLE